jgi:hypothetical protein
MRVEFPRKLPNLGHTESSAAAKPFSGVTRGFSKRRPSEVSIAGQCLESN